MWLYHRFNMVKPRTVPDYGIESGHYKDENDFCKEESELMFWDISGSCET